jgi:LPXTG-site transpeptidase (sortase) family protein
MKSIKLPHLKRPSKNQLFMALGLLLITTGLVFGGLNEINSWLNTRGKKVEAQGLKNTPLIKNDSPLITGTPDHISIPDVNIDLAVIPGYYNPNDQSWTLTLDKAQWGAMTSKPNNKGGVTYIYGHYRVHVFYTLPKIQPGSLATVTTENGHTFTYRYTSSIVTKPEDTSLFKYQGKPILVLQTCTGAWYQYRQLFSFDLIQVDGKAVPATVAKS